MQRILTISARVLGLAAILFISSFALDVFGTDQPMPQTLLALAIHLIPTYLLVAILIVAWRLPLVGGILFLVVSLVPFMMLDRNPMWVNALLAGPFVLVGVLFALADIAGRRHN